MTRIIEEEVDEILAQRLQEPGTLVDAIQLVAFAKTTKSPTASQEEKESALRSLKEYKADDDPFE